MAMAHAAAMMAAEPVTAMSKAATAPLIGQAANFTTTGTTDYTKTTEDAGIEGATVSSTPGRTTAGEIKKLLYGMVVCRPARAARGTARN